MNFTSARMLACVDNCRKAEGKKEYIMTHDDYYYNLRPDADERLARVSHASHRAETCSERFEQFANVVGPRTAAAIEAFVDGRVAHHELNEHRV